LKNFSPYQLEKLPNLQEVQTERAKRDPLYFSKLVGLEPDKWQKEVLWEQKNLLMNCARQSGKSTIAALYAVHQAISLDNSLILLVSPSQRQSGELFRKVKDWLEKLPIPPEMPEDNLLSCQMGNGSRIVSLPGSEKTIRGYSGATLIIEDEAARVQDELYMAIRPMLAVSQGRLILMSTPFGKRGHFWEAWDKGGEDWKRVKVRADENPRISKSFLDEEKRVMGDWWYRQEYECEFLDAISSVFSFDAVMSAVSEDIKPLFEVAQ